MRIAEARSEADLIEALEHERTRRLEARRPFEEIWWNNIALVAGDHYMRWDSTLGTYVERPKDDSSIRIVLNHARVVARTELARLTKARPIMEVIPSSEDGEDLAAAKVGDFVLDAMEWKHSIKRRRKQALWWMILTGIGAIYTGYDPDDDTDGRKEYYIDPNTKEPTFNAARIKDLEAQFQEGVLDELPKESYAFGDLCFEVYSPFQMLPDDSVSEWNEIADIILTDVVQIDKARSTWDVEVSPDLGSQPSVVQQRMLRRLGLGTHVAEMQQTQDTAQVHTYWLKPGIFNHNPFLKDGIMVRWTNQNKKLEFNKPYPYNDKRIPLAFYEHVPNATAIWPDCVLTDIRDANLELDKTVSQLLENRDYMANPAWLIPVQCQIKGQIRSRPGMQIKYTYVRDIGPPTPVPGQPLPIQVENTAVALRDQILDLSGQGEVSRGRVPSGVRSGIQIQYLQDEDETKMGPTADNVGEATALMASMTLSRCAQYYSVQRLLRNYKRGGGHEVRKFKGADLKGNTDVVYVEGSALAKSKAAKQQNAVTMAELVPGSVAPKRLHDILELGGAEPDEYDMAKAQAGRENEKMIGEAKKTAKQHFSETSTMAPEEQAAYAQQQAHQQGPQAIPVKRWHNHEAHNEEHKHFMMSDEYERLIMEYPDLDRLFDEHISMHEKFMQEIQAQQMQMAMLARGGPDGPPGQPPQAAPSAQVATA